MKLESIKELLETVRQYNTVNIKQTFTKTETDWIEIKYQPNTRILESIYAQTKAVNHYESIDEAATAIAAYMNTHSTDAVPNPSENLE